ncbi:hypothetical protein R3P38DRAFT_3227658 [Favolaschia claudopus]|uniref:Uncharacterized protein n=1 Tax=Favolaschia claudopus TaxID=2862362 RepID=A0AAV9ZSH5_9AGAR
MTDFSTIANCWVHAGILPSDKTKSRAVDELELENDEGVRELSKVLNELQEGVLQKGNRLDIEALVNFPEEQFVEGATEEELFEEVIASGGAGHGGQRG